MSSILRLISCEPVYCLVGLIYKQRSAIDEPKCLWIGMWYFCSDLLPTVFIYRAATDGSKCPCDLSNIYGLFGLL